MSRIKSKIFGGTKTTEEILGKKKFVFKDKNTEVAKPKEYKKPAPRKKDSYPKLSFNDFNPVKIIMPIIMLLVGITVFSQVYSSLNTSIMSSSSSMSIMSGPMSSMLNLIPLAFVAAIAIGIITTILKVSF
jgi:hypothetical protein